VEGPPAGLRRSGDFAAASLAVRTKCRLDARGHGHIADSVGAANAEHQRFRSSAAMWWK
jgi:hypothetical protein